MPGYGGVSGGGAYGGGGMFNPGGNYYPDWRYPQKGPPSQPNIPGPPPPKPQLPGWWLQFIQQGQQMAQQPTPENQYLTQAGNVAGQLQGLNTQNITLNPAVLNAINAIRQAQIGAVNRAYTQNKSGVLQDLYGRGMAQSSAALDKGNRLGEFLAQGLSQAEADAGARQMQAYQEAYQNRLAALTGSGNLYNSLAGTNQQAIQDAFKNKLAAMNQTMEFGQQGYLNQQADQQALYEWQWKKYAEQMQRYQEYMAKHPTGVSTPMQPGAVGGGGYTGGYKPPYSGQYPPGYGGPYYGGGGYSGGGGYGYGR